MNGANFTDGLDGLASSVTVLIATFFTVAAIGMGHNDLAGWNLAGILCDGWLTSWFNYLMYIRRECLWEIQVRLHLGDLWQQQH